MLPLSAILRFVRIDLVPTGTPRRFNRRSNSATLAIALAALGAAMAGTAPAQTSAATTAILSVASGGTSVSSVASGSVVTLTATVKASGIAVTPGQVNFCDATAATCSDIHLLGTAQLTTAGIATFRFRPAIGVHSFKARFVGTNKYAASASTASALTVTGTIGQLASTTTIARTGVWGTYALSATVTESGNTLSPTGNVSFVDTSTGNSILKTLPLGSGTAGVNWPNPKTLALSTQAGGVGLGDFNGDGIPDVAAVSGERPLYVYLGNANGSFTAATTPSSLAYTFGPLVVADFNGDGKQDIAVLDGDTNTVMIFLGNGDGTFSVVASSPSTGLLASQLVAGDFNGDGVPDLAVTSHSTDTVEILLGNGDGTFTSASSSPVLGNYPSSIAVADLNGDGKADLAVTDLYDDIVWILLSKGDGTFAASGNLHSGVRDSPVAIADFNGDGKPDLAVGTGGAGANPITILAGNGDGTFTEPSPVPTVTASLLTSIGVGDFNADGVPDIALTDPATGVARVLLNNGSASFSTFSIVLANAFNAPFFLSVGDINGDGRPDLLIGNSSTNSVGVFLTAPTETVTSTADLSVAGVGQHLVEASYTGDSHYTASASGTTPLWGVQPATTTSLSLTSAGTQTSSVVPGSVVTLTAAVRAGASPVTPGSVNFCDASATVCTDIHLLGTAALNSSGTAVFSFVPGSGVHTYKAEFVEGGYGLASSSPVATLTVGPAPSPVYSDTAGITISGGFPGDYSLTGTVVGYGGTAAPTGNVSFLDTSVSNTILATAPLGASTPGEGWLVSQTPAVGSTPIAEAAADFNGDGIPDLAVAFENSSATASVTILFGKGDGTFTVGPTTQTPQSANYQSVYMTASDFNADGKADLAILGYSIGAADTVVTLLGKGDGTFTQTQPNPIYNQGAVGGDFIQGSMVAADFNGDGKMDLAMVGDYANSGGVTIALGKGDGTFQPVAPNFAITQGFDVVATGDFNGDGVPDLVASNYFGPGLSTVLLGNGDGTMTALTTTLPTSTFVRGIATGDFNGDGKLDLAFGYDNGVAIFLGNGDGSFTQAPGSPLTGYGASLVAGDFNHDGKLDLAAIDDYNLQINLFLGNGDGTFTTKIATPGLPQIHTNLYAAIVPADLNGDGSTDLALVTVAQDTVSVLITVPTETATAIVTGIAPAGPGTHNVDASYKGDGNYPSSVSGTVALQAGLQPLAMSPAPGTYTSPQTITITESVPGSTIYYSAQGPITTNGFVPYTGPIQLSQSGIESINVYATETGYVQAPYLFATYTINLPVTPSITWPTPAPITYGTPLSSTQLNATTTAAGSFVYSPPAGTVLGAGQQTLTATFTPTDTTKYTTATSSVTLKVNLATPALSTVGSSINPSLASSSVTFTASATATSGMPTGSIAFLDGSTQIGSVMLSAGSASFTPSTLAAGSHAITAVYSGDINFVAMRSPVLTQMVESYSIATPTGGSSSATVPPGGQASYLLAVTPPSVGASLTFSVTGLPAGATASFSPSTVAVGAAPTNVTLTVILPATADLKPIHRPFRHDDLPVLLGLFLLPIAGKFRRTSWAKRVPFLLGIVCILITAASVSGCGSGSSGSGGTGGGSTPTSYSLSVTAISGSLTQSTSLTLTVN